MSEKPNLLKQINYLGESSMTTMQSIFWSILLLPTPEKVLQKFNEVAQFLKLTDIEKQVIKEVETSIGVSGGFNPEYIRNKFSYYFDAAPVTVVQPSELDYAILDRKVKEEKNVISKDLLKLANEIDDLSPQELKQRINELTNQKLITTDHIEMPESGLQYLDNAYEDLIQDNGVYSLLLPEVEKHTGKAGVGHVISILAFVGSFKSTYALNLAYKNALEGHNVLFLSLESTEKAMVSRMVLNHVAETAKHRQDLVSQDAIISGSLTTEQSQLYNNKHNELVSLIGNNFIMYDSVKIKSHTFLEMTNVLRGADQKFRETTGRGLELLVLDQLANLKHTDPTGTNKRYSYVGALLDEWMTYFRQQSLSFLGEDRQITSIIVSQVRREAYAEASKPKNKGRYDASAGGDSNEIERTSDTMITLYKDLDTKNTLLVYVPKARHGSIPDKPIQVEVYGEYYHVGPLQTLEGANITAESFEKSDFKLADLLKK